MNKIAIVGGALAVVTLGLVGCHRDDFALTWDMTTLAEHSAMPLATNAPLSIAVMKPTDVILAVNGYPLTKQAYEDFMELKLRGLRESKDANELVIQKQMDEIRITYIKNFIGQRLLVDNAFELGVVTTNEVVAAVEKKLKENARKRGKTVAQLLKKFAGKERYYLYELCVAEITDRLISKKIPPKSVVDKDFVKAVQDQVAKENVKADKQNAQLKARLADYRKQILDKKLDFLKVAHSLETDDAGEGVWGEFEEGDMDDPGIQAKVFALKEGDVSEVLEDDNGYHLVKVLKVTPPEKNEKGRVITRERRKLAHLYLEKAPLIIRQGDIQMTADLKHQMQIQAVNEYVTGLSTNAATRIEYPHGQDLF